MSSVTEHPAPAGTAPAQQPAGLLRSVLVNQHVLLLVALAGLVAYFTARDSVFISTPEIAVLLTNFASLILLATGETFVIISGGIDLSVGATTGFSGVVAALAMRDMISAHNGEALVLIVGTLICAGIGTGIGLINAALMNWARLVPFVATLATLGAGTGMALVLSNGLPIGSDSSALSLGADRFGPFPYLFLVVFAIVVISWLYLHLSRYGRYTYAIGSNSFAARAAGIDVRRHLTSVYALSGLLAGLTGIDLRRRVRAHRDRRRRHRRGQPVRRVGTADWHDTRRADPDRGDERAHHQQRLAELEPGRRRDLYRRRRQPAGPARAGSEAVMTGERQPLYEARHIDKSYGSVIALSDVSVSLYPGEVLGLVGDNGAGKSTLVKVLSGVHNPDKGELFLDGTERHWKSPHDTIEAGVETLYQDAGLAPDLTIGSNVFLGREKAKPGLLGKLGFLAQKDMETEALSAGRPRARRHHRPPVQAHRLPAIRRPAPGRRDRTGHRLGPQGHPPRRADQPPRGPPGHRGALGDPGRQGPGARGHLHLAHTAARAPGDRPGRGAAPRQGRPRRANLTVRRREPARHHHRPHRDDLTPAQPRPSGRALARRCCRTRVAPASNRRAPGDSAPLPSGQGGPPSSEDDHRQPQCLNSSQASSLARGRALSCHGLDRAGPLRRPGCRRSWSTSPGWWPAGQAPAPRPGTRRRRR